MKAEQAALREVEDALITVRKTGECRIAQGQQAAASQSALHFANQRYQGGRASYLDVLTNQRSRLDAEMGLARTGQTQLVLAVQLARH
jgi:outer membrane protein TolC